MGLASIVLVLSWAAFKPVDVSDVLVEGAGESPPVCGGDWVVCAEVIEDFHHHFADSCASRFVGCGNFTDQPFERSTQPSLVAITVAYP